MIFRQRLVRVTLGCLAFSTALAAVLFADGPADNDAARVRRIPKLGIELSETDRRALEGGLSDLRTRIAALRGTAAEEIRSHLPDVEIFYRAVRDALEHQEFFSERDVQKARQLLEAGAERAEALAEGKAPWLRESGLIVLGYVSRIDHSVQPYGLVVPGNYSHRGTDRVRLDVWFHGRGETLSEVNFLDQRMNQTGRYAPRDTIVLHPYGRYCNAFKFAGEVDVLEALEDVQRRYRVDRDRVSVRGFSMGGAACWQFAVHYPDLWFAANPGAGFSETPEFLRLFQQETLKPTWYEEKLWRLYDCPGYAVNLSHCPTVAYSGELDRQKQAADVMESALADEGIALVHLIGPQTRHTIDEGSKRLVEDRMASLAARGRQGQPKQVSLVTYTLKYNRMHWLTIDALKTHWEQARVEAVIEPPDRISLSLRNVTDFSLRFPPGGFPRELSRVPDLLISADERGDDGLIASADLPKLNSDRSWACRVHLSEGGWLVGPPPAALRKKHDLQGPIDDAFMDSFIFVRPGASCRHPQVDQWVQAEFEHAVLHWRQQFRGDARVKQDSEVTEQDIAGANLVLFGDPAANQLLARIARRLPIDWDDKQLKVGKRVFDAASHVPLLIYPNPLNPERYVVLNSGFTYREYDYLNNARQVPKLPDWAVVDAGTPITSRSPGTVVDADFFGEQWELR